MNLVGRNVVSIEDLSNEEIQSIFLLARDIQQHPRRYMDRLRGSILATLFYEASTRTRLSFESAMQRLGGGVISAWDVSATSAAKGETLEDTCRVVSGYADIIVLRHPWEGAAQAIADRVDLPVINAGDGGHEHPTQTLCDLYTIWLTHGEIEGLQVALCGDLKFGRTIHSLVYGLVRFKANITLLPGEGQALPDHVQRKLRMDYGIDLGPLENPGSLLALYPGGNPSHLANGVPDIIYMTPSQPHEPTLFPNGVKLPDGVSWDHLYFTRAQKERWGGGDDVNPDSNPRVNAEVMELAGFEKTSILHPLPRQDEISRDVDDDQRSLYFKQAANGVPVRMALLLLLLEGNQTGERASPMSRTSEDHVVHSNGQGSACQNEACITNQEVGVEPLFCVIPDAESYWLRCYFCDFDFQTLMYGNTASGKYHPVSHLFNEQPVSANTAFFRSADEAKAAGFEPVSERTRRAPSHTIRWPALEPAKVKS